jgi:Endonuclease/Exonuclease/phosphatase family
VSRSSSGLSLESDVSTSLVLGWWNTSLSPSGRCQATAEDLEVASNVVHFLITDWGIHCLALGEVTPDNLKMLRDRCGRSSDYSILSNAERVGRAQFETGILFDRRRLELFNDKQIVTSRAGCNFKISSRADFVVDDFDEPIHIFVSHWPSRRTRPEDDPIRDRLGIRLADALKDIRAEYGNGSRIIVLGDFNDEPFDDALAEQLCGTRDRRLATQKADLLYNPFWRLMGERDAHIPGKKPPSNAGTCFHKNGETTKWRTFDQILYSSSFLHPDGWQLDERESNIIRTLELRDLVTDRNSRFDHLPVTGVITIHDKKEIL